MYGVCLFPLCLSVSMYSVSVWQHSRGYTIALELKNKNNIENNQKLTIMKISVFYFICLISLIIILNLSELVRVFLLNVLYVFDFGFCM